MRIIFTADGVYSTLNTALSSIMFAWKQIFWSKESLFVQAHLCDDFLMWQLIPLGVYFQKRGSRSHYLLHQMKTRLFSLWTACWSNWFGMSCTVWFTAKTTTMQHLPTGPAVHTIWLGKLWSQEARFKVLCKTTLLQWHIKQTAKKDSVLYFA